MPLKKENKLRFYKNCLKKNATKAELAFEAILKELNIKYMFQKGFIAGRSFFIVDFYIPRPHKTVFEIDGKSHNPKRQKNYDFRRTQTLKKRGIRVFRFKNKEVINKRNEVKDKISFVLDLN